MRKILRIASAIALLCGLALWLGTGGSLGWTKTSEMTTRIEPVTGLEERVWKKRFVPGADFLVATGVVAGLMFCSSFLFRKKSLNSERDG